MDFPIAGLGTVGVIADAAPVDVPVSGFTTVQNIRFRDGYAQRFGGLAQASPLTAPSIVPYWLQPFNTVSARYWVYAGLTSVYADDGTGATDITNTARTGAIDNRWTGGVLSGVLVMSNGVDTPQYWGGTGTLTDLPGFDPTWTVRSLKPFKNYLVGVGWTIGGDERPHLLKWSAAAEPGAVPTSWDETDPTIDAAELDVAFTADEMVDQLPMGDVNVLYKDQSMWAMRYVGGNQIFEVQRLPGEVGAIAVGCIADTPVGHVVLAYGDVVLHSGQGPQSIIDGKMRRWLQNRISTEHFKRSFLAVNHRASEVWVCFPEAGADACTLALVWSWRSGVLGVRNLPSITYGAAGRQPQAASSLTWETFGGTWEDAQGSWIAEENNASEVRLLLSNDSNLLLADQGSTDDGEVFTSFVERIGLAFEAPETVKTARGMFLRVDAAAGTTLTVEIGAAMTAEEYPAFDDPVTYIVGESYKVDSYATGRFLAYRITSTEDFRIASLEFDLVKRGRY